MNYFYGAVFAERVENPDGFVYHIRDAVMGR